ncbi:hypothetical protein AB0A69_30700 [Streptomyces sp. NPDC045431]|uniref:hypothetical protein n=1 Tax=Streptomyces sp. NPDC045431 TaxID=3155613 RepID=UPI0033E185C7
MDHAQPLAASNGAAITRGILALLPDWVTLLFCGLVVACVLAALAVKVRRRFRT